MNISELLNNILYENNFIVGIVGDLGEGKTFMAVTLSILLNMISDKEIYSNTPLNIDHTFIEYSSQLLDMHNKVVLIDELQLYADCRKSTSKTNFFTSGITTDIRKFENIFIYTTPDIPLIDLRIRKRTLLFLTPKRLYNNKLIFEILIKDRKYHEYDKLTLNLEPFKKFYNTNYKPIPYDV